MLADHALPVQYYDSRSECTMAAKYIYLHNFTHIYFSHSQLFVLTVQFILAKLMALIYDSLPEQDP